MDNFLQNDGIVNSIASKDKTRLVIRNNGRQNRLDTISNYFSDNFVNNVTYSNGPKIRGPGRIKNFKRVWLISPICSGKLKTCCTKEKMDGPTTSHCDLKNSGCKPSSPGAL